MGVALLPRAGVALGAALVAAQRFPEVVASTVLFEVLGPVSARCALERAAGE
jgi:hypothetical protein